MAPIVLIVGIGYWGYRRDLFSHVLFLILLSMIVNTALKCLFQVPLKPHLNQHEWYAFPSGHMQLATVLYGRLWWVFRKTKWAQLLLILLGGIGWAMIWRNYHDFIDVFAGVIAGVGLLLAYAVFTKWPLVRKHPEGIGFFLLPLTAPLIFLMPSIPQHMAHVWQAQGGVLGVSLGMIFLKLKKITEFPLSKGLAGIKAFLGLSVLVLMWSITPFLFGGLGYPLFLLLSFFLLGLWLSAGPDLIVHLMYRRKRQ